jgi:hypothetical protein
MKHLKDIVVESFFDNEIDDSKQFEDSVKDEIKQFLGDNYKGRCSISKNPDADGNYIVNSKSNIEIKNKKITSLTNGCFVWGEVGGDFDCSECMSLTSLEGAPKKVGGSFECLNCHSLKSLEGAPKEVGWFFDCEKCDTLTSLKGAPEKVGAHFYCNSCDSLESLEGAPKEVGGVFVCAFCKSLTSLEGVPEKISGKFDCSGCQSLTSLKGAPKKVNGEFDCRGCKVQFTEDDVRKVTAVIGPHIKY